MPALQEASSVLEQTPADAQTWNSMSCLQKSHSSRRDEETYATSQRDRIKSVWKMQRKLQNCRRIKKVCAKKLVFFCEKHEIFIFRHCVRKHFTGKIFECHCGSVYTTMFRLKIHQQSHSAEKIIVCEVCKKEYDKLVNLKAHWKRVHLRTHGVYLGKECKFLLKSMWNNNNKFLIFFSSKSHKQKRSVYLRQMRDQMQRTQNIPWPLQKAPKDLDFLWLVSTVFLPQTCHRRSHYKSSLEAAPFRVQDLWQEIFNPK